MTRQVNVLLRNAGKQRRVRDCKISNAVEQLHCGLRGSEALGKSM